MVGLLKIPYITTQQMIEVDRLMVDVFGIQLVQMMENAGRQLAVLARKRFLDGDPVNKKVIVLAGSGGNGGGAMVSARNLHNWGAKVDVFLTKPVRELSGVIHEQAKILQTMDVDLQTVIDFPKDPAPDLIIDGIIGYSLQGPPGGIAAEMINWVNRLETPVLSLDVPSGLDAGTGEIHSPAIHATATMTLALPKTGLRQPGAENVGELYLADIGVPPELYENPLLKLLVGPIFQKDQVIRLS